MTALVITDILFDILFEGEALGLGFSTMQWLGLVFLFLGGHG